MSRERYPFHTKVRVRYSDMDPNNHMTMSKYLTFADEASGPYMAKLGYGNLGDIGSNDRMLFVANINCDFVGECRTGDLLRIDLGYTRLGNSSVSLGFWISNDKTEELLAKGSMIQVFVDPKTRKSAPIPDFFRKAVIEAQGDLLDS